MGFVGEDLADAILDLVRARILRYDLLRLISILHRKGGHMALFSLLPTLEDGLHPAVEGH